MIPVVPHTAVAEVPKIGSQKERLGCFGRKDGSGSISISLSIFLSICLFLYLSVHLYLSVYPLYLPICLCP